MLLTLGPALASCRTPCQHTLPSLSARRRPRAGNATAWERARLGADPGWAALLCTRVQVPDAAYEPFRKAAARGAEAHAAWNKVAAEYKAKYPEEYAEFESIVTGERAGAGRAGCWTKSSLLRVLRAA
jgi:transketolase